MSLDGCLVGFNIDMELYYSIAGQFEVDAVLVGSRTAEAGLDMFMDSLPEETEQDCKKQNNKDKIPPFIISDSRGRLQGKLHAIRRSEYCGDVIILTSDATPKSYLQYLQDREYEVIIQGRDRVHYPYALKELAERFGFSTIRSDSGGVLNCILLEQGLVDEISFLIAPYIVGGKHHLFFDTLKLGNTQTLELTHCEQLPQGYVWVRYTLI